MTLIDNAIAQRSRSAVNGDECDAVLENGKRTRRIRNECARE
jgi:hypothetical protein